MTDTIQHKSPPRAGTKCARRACALPYRDHVGGYCLGTAGKTFLRYPRYTSSRRVFPAYPSPKARCGRKLCQRILALHVGGKCPFNPALKFHVRKPYDGRCPRARLTMSLRHLEAAAAVLSVVQRGGDARLVARMHAVKLGQVLGLVTRARQKLCNRAAPSSDADASPDASTQPGVAGALEGACSSLTVAREVAR